MADRKGRFDWLDRLARLCAVLWALLMMAAFAAATILLVRLVRAGTVTQPAALWAWLVVLLALPAGVVAAVVTAGLVRVIVRNESGVAEVADHVKRLESLTEALHESSRRLVDLSQMSDTAKSLLFRQRESEAINELLHEYLLRQDYAGAQNFVADIERQLGYAAQAEQMRREIAEARETTIDQKVDSAINRINRSIIAHDWAQALRQARRLLQLLPDNRKVAALPRQIREARAGHKRELLQAYGDAVRRSDIDRSIELIRELDKYLTPQEAAALEESARGVFRARLHNLGVQFAIRVTDEQWADAVAIGQEIIDEYPNTRMAQEVREKMGQLRALADAAGAGEGGEAPGPA